MYLQWFVFDLQQNQKIDFVFSKRGWSQKRSIITTPKSDDGHKNNTNIIVKSIHSSLRSESKNNYLYYSSKLTYKIIFYSFYEVKISGKMKKMKVKNYKLESFSWSSSQGSRHLLVLPSGIKYEQSVYNIKNLN